MPSITQKVLPPHSNALTTTERGGGEGTISRGRRRVTGDFSFVTPPSPADYEGGKERKECHHFQLCSGRKFVGNISLREGKEKGKREVSVHSLIHHLGHKVW